MLLKDFLNKKYELTFKKLKSEREKGRKKGNRREEMNLGPKNSSYCDQEE